MTTCTSRTCAGHLAGGPNNVQHWHRDVQHRDVGQHALSNTRRHIKTFSYPGQIDRLFGALAITRSWNIRLSVLRILKA
jgi:hypothetical protein